MPGVIVEDRDTARPRSAPTDTSVGFFAAEAQKGTHTAAIEVTSLSQVETLLGTEVSYSYLIRSLKQFFSRGGSKAYVARVVGPTPVYASLNIAGTGTTLVATAGSVGAWANGATGGYSVQVVNGPSGGTHRVLIVFYNAVEVGRTAEFNDRTAVNGVSIGDVTFTLGGGSGLPTVAAAANLASGTDDNTNVTATQRETALGLFLASLGPGQVAMPGITAAQSHQDLIEHGEAYDRAPILDGPNTTVEATLVAANASLPAVTGAKKAAMFAPWVNVPGTATGTTQLVPPSGIVMGKIAQTDRTAGVGQPAAGDFGIIDRAVSLTATFSDTDADDINEAGINLIRDIDGDLTIYGWRSLVSPDDDPTWWAFTVSRLSMMIKANAKAVGRRVVFRKIDGFGHLTAEFQGLLDGFMRRLYLNGDIYADPEDQRPETAYRINVSSGLNTPEDLASGFLEAEISFRPSPFAELVTIGVIVVPITESVEA